MGNQSFSKIWIIVIIVVLLVGGILAWQHWFRKISPEKLGEIAFLQNGDIWVASENFESKYKAIDTKEAITNFAISPDGKEIYWLNEKKELWKRDYDGAIKPLVSIEKDMEEVAIKEGIEALNGKTSYLKGEVEGFWLSPDGKFIVYTRLEEFIGCCGGTSNVPVDWVWIMKNDGTEKVAIERPFGVTRNVVIFDKWFPDSKKILFHFQFADESTQGSPFFEGGVAGKNPKVYSAMYEESLGPDATAVVFVVAEPVFSPDGTKMAYFSPGGWIQLAVGISRVVHSSLG